MTGSPPEREEAAASAPEGVEAAPRFALRPEVADDAAFRLALFSVSRGAAWDQVPLPAALRAQIMAQQFHAQTQGYGAAHPTARLEIVTVDAVPIGRLATDRDAEALRLIDIALSPDWRGRGVGGTIVRALVEEAQDLGLPLILQVARDNLAAQRLYHRLGFTLAATTDTDLTLVWRETAPGAA